MVWARLDLCSCCESMPGRIAFLFSFFSDVEVLISGIVTYSFPVNTPTYSAVSVPLDCQAAAFFWAQIPTVACIGYWVRFQRVAKLFCVKKLIGQL